jgi:soluble lytic murein transglycosylase-like protein
MSALNKLLYKRIIFCQKCHRSMFVGINKRFLAHLLRHTAINKLLILLAVPGLISLYPATVSVMSARKVDMASYISEEEYKQEKVVRAVLRRVVSDGEETLNTLPKIIVQRAREKQIDPKLVAAVIVVESRGNPLAISNSKSVGLMQIHLPTWATEIDFSQKNPFNPETNIEMGTAILAGYLKKNGNLKSALSAYEGSVNPEISDYAGRVLEIYNSRVPIK